MNAARMEPHLRTITGKGENLAMSETRNSSIVSAGLASPFHASAYRPAILVVDNESAIADTLAKMLARSGFRATAQYDGESALETALLTPPDLLIANVLLPAMKGVDLARSIKRVYPDCKILLFSRRNGRLSFYPTPAAQAIAALRPTCSPRSEVSVP